MAVTAQQLIDRARQRADFVSSPFLDDSSELLNWCSESYRELWDLLVEAYGDRLGMGIVDITTAAQDPQKTISVTGGILKLIRVDREVDGIRIPMFPFDFADTVLDDTPQSWDARTVRYNFFADTMYFLPCPDTIYTIRLYYVPRVSFTSLSGAMLPPTESWSEYVVVDLAIKMRVKEESDTSDLRLDKENLRRRIISVSTPREETRAARTADVRYFDDEQEDALGDIWP